MAKTKPLPRKQRVLNRGYLYSRSKEDMKTPSVTLMDMDSAIMFYFENVIKPSVKDNDENIKVPIMYSSPERWKAIKRDGFMRDKKRQVITPVITYRRTSIERDDTIPQDKLDANNPHLFYTFEKKFTQENRYDNMSTQIGLLPQREYYNVALPDYVTLTYDFIIWTSYIEQMNKIVERITYSDGAYWGDPDKLRFRSRVDSFTDATEVSDVERLVRTNFSVTLRGYLLPEGNFDHRSTTQKFLSPKKVIFGAEADTIITQTTGRTGTFLDGLADEVKSLGGGTEKELVQFPDKSFDYAILSQTLQAFLFPEKVLKQLLRIGKQTIVSIPNFGYWKIRLHLLFKGTMPLTKNLPNEWYNTPNLHMCTIQDFVNFCKEKNIKIDRSLCLTNEKISEITNGNMLYKNIFSQLGIFLIK